jgi:hypothetical protein
VRVTGLCSMNIRPQSVIIVTAEPAMQPATANHHDAQRLQSVGSIRDSVNAMPNAYYRLQSDSPEWTSFIIILNNSSRRNAKDKLTADVVLVEVIML